MDTTLTGGFVDAPTQAADYFRAALGVMAKPGSVAAFHGVSAPGLPDAATALLLTLTDPETPLHLAPSLASADVAAWLAFHTGAPVADRGDAQFAVGRWDELLPLTDFAVGSAEYPDRSATLIVLCDALDHRPNTRISGPGLKAPKNVWLPDPVLMQANHKLYPLGLDFLFVSGAEAMGLPRSTKIEVL